MLVDLWQGSRLPPATITVSNWPYLSRWESIFHSTLAHMCSLATKVCASLALSLLPLKARRMMDKWGWA